MSDFQRIFVVSTNAAEADLDDLRARLGRLATVLTAPTAEGKRVVRALGREAVPDLILAPVRFPGVDRGHRLDDLVRQHAVQDRYRDVVVVADPATVTLLLRVLAPDQLAEGGSVTQVGLPRSPRPLPLGPTALGGVGLALVTGLLASLVPIWVLPALVALSGLVLLLAPGRRALGQALLLSIPVAAVVGILVIAGSARFPGAW